jgi:hypothetical protein
MRFHEGSGVEYWPGSVRFEKSCNCRGTSSTGKLRISAGAGEGRQINFRVTYHRGLSCDLCGQPWRVTPLVDPPPMTPSQRPAAPGTPP